MKNKYIIFRSVLDILFALLSLVWLFLPLFNYDNSIFAPFFLPLHVFKINLNFSPLNSFFGILIYLLGLIALFKIIVLFLRRKMELFWYPTKILPILLNIFGSAIIVLFFVIYILKNANNLNFFIIQKIQLYIVSSVAVIFNIFNVSSLISQIHKKKDIFNEYIHFIRAKENKLKNEETLEEEVVKNRKIFISIQKKLLFSFTTLAFVLIISLSYLLLKDYKSTILDSIEYSGKKLAEQSADYFRPLLASSKAEQRISLNAYTHKEKNKNLNSKLKFNSLNFFMKQKKVNKFVIEYSTDEKLIGKALPSTKKNQYKKIKLSEKDYQKKYGFYDFVAPIKFSSKLIGFSIVRYNEDVIYAPFFRTQIRVIIFALLFLYITIIIIYLIGQKIVLPILFLRMNVKKISNLLIKMIKGEERISANSLSYTNVIESNDEIKALSLEVKNMVTVIKSVIPYVSASTLKQANKKTSSSSTRKNMTFLFTDIRGFTTMCEGMKANEVVTILNEYLELQSKIILANNGDIDKFVGDEIMAVFDGPKKELDACRASMQIREAMQAIREERETKNLSVVSIGIGIHSGEVVFGSVGAQERMDFTSIGDTVNLAARLEGANKQYFTKSLITEKVFKKISGQFLCREIDLLTVKGKNQPVRIYEIFQTKKKAKKELFEFKKKFEDGLEKYRKQKWHEAMDIFEELSNIYKDKTSDVFIKRIKIFMNTKNPNPTWNGVFTMTSK